MMNGLIRCFGLPEKFSPMIMAIEHSGIAITADSIKTKLLELETDVGKAGSAFVSKAVSYSKKHTGSAQSDTKKEILCYKCKQLGTRTLR